MRFADACPSCQREIRCRHLLDGSLGLTFRCPHCKARLRLASVRHLLIAWFYVFGLAALAMTCVTVVPIQPILLRIVVVAVVTILLGGFIALTYPLQGKRLCVHDPSSLAGRRYRLVFMLLVGLTIVALFPYAISVGARLKVMEAQRLSRMR